jgi:predicted O-methyltransferase YrrM
MGIGKIANVAEATWDRASRSVGLRSAWWRLSRWSARTRPYLTLLGEVAKLEGDILECGVFRGRSLLRMALAARELCPEKRVIGLDSFDGFPSETITSGDLGPGRTLEKVRGRFKGASRTPLRLLRAAAEMNLNIELHPGFFDKTLPSLAGRKFCFVHLDCDIYESYKTCLEALYEQVVPGGVILFDEYACSVWPGATRAVDEFFAERLEKPQMRTDAKRPTKPKYYIVKQAARAAKHAA